MSGIARFWAAALICVAVSPPSYGAVNVTDQTLEQAGFYAATELCPLFIAKETQETFRKKISELGYEKSRGSGEQGDPNFGVLEMSQANTVDGVIAVGGFPNGPICMVQLYGSDQEKVFKQLREHKFPDTHLFQPNPNRSEKFGEVVRSAYIANVNQDTDLHMFLITEAKNANAPAEIHIFTADR